MLDNIPNAAAQVAHRLGIAAPAAFDINTACSGFCYGSPSRRTSSGPGTVRHVLVIGAEKLSDWMDWDDRSTCIIFADGAGAAVVGAAPDAESVGIGPVAWGSAGDQAQTIRINPDTRALHQEGQAVFRWATTPVAPVALRAVELAGLSLADIDVLVPHQANLRIVEAIAKRLRSKGARADLRVADDIVHSGNTSSASIPLALDHMRAQGRLRSGETVLLVGFGAGLTYAARSSSAPDARAESQPDPTSHVPHRRRTAWPTSPRSRPASAEIVEEVAGIDAAEVTPEKSFVDDLDIDSLSMVEIAVQAEDRFGVKIPDDQLAQLKTVSDAVDYIAKNQ